jgi:hypothetical protein
MAGRKKWLAGALGWPLHLIGRWRKVIAGEKEWLEKSNRWRKVIAGEK